MCITVNLIGMGVSLYKGLRVGPLGGEILNEGLYGLPQPILRIRVLKIYFIS